MGVVRDIVAGFACGLVVLMASCSGTQTDGRDRATFVDIEAVLDGERRLRVGLHVVARRGGGLVGHGIGFLRSNAEGAGRRGISEHETRPPRGDPWPRAATRAGAEGAGAGLTYSPRTGEHAETVHI